MNHHDALETWLHVSDATVTLYTCSLLCREHCVYTSGDRSHTTKEWTEVANFVYSEGRLRPRTYARLDRGHGPHVVRRD